MIEGPFKETSYYYPGEKIMKFLASLSTTDETSNQHINISDKILIMTHDDMFDTKMATLEKEYQVKSTWFLFAEFQEQVPQSSDDVQLHFDKDRSSLPSQVELFKRVFKRCPIFNRIHRFFWRADNFDFPYLALNGFKVDSSKIGVRPYRICIAGKILPIWEVPMSITDHPGENFMASYSIAKDVETMFVNEVTPITVLAHPFAVIEEKHMNSCFYEAIECYERYGYKSMNMTEFYDKYLGDVDDE